MPVVRLSRRQRKRCIIRSGLEDPLLAGLLASRILWILVRIAFEVVLILLISRVRTNADIAEPTVKVCCTPVSACSPKVFLTLTDVLLVQGPITNSSSPCS